MGYQVLMLQLKSQSVKMKDKLCIRVNIGKLNEVSSTSLSTLYIY